MILAFGPTVFAPGPKVLVGHLWWSEPLDRECFSAPVSSDNESYFYVLPCAAWWRVRSGSWMAAATALLDEVYAFLRAARWRALSGSREEHLLRQWNVTAAGLLLDICTCWCVSVYSDLVSECAQTRRLPLTSPSLAG